MKDNKFLVLILVLFCVGLASAIIPTTQVPSFNTYNIKWMMCDQFNLTKWDCDVWWESDSNPYYIKPSSDGLNYSTIKNDFYNKTEVNQHLQNYYNKSEILSLFSSNDELNLNISTDFYNKSEIDEQVKRMMVNFTDRFVTDDDLDDFNLKEQGSSSGSLSDTTIIIIFLVIVGGGIGFLIYNKSSQSKPDYNGNYGTVGMKKIHSTKHMDQEQQIKELKNKLNESQKEEKDGSNS